MRYDPKHVPVIPIRVKYDYSDIRPGFVIGLMMWGTVTWGCRWALYEYWDRH